MAFFRILSFLLGLASLAQAGNLAVSFSDCGDASTDVVVKDVVPKTIAAGSTTTITGSGSLKKDITGGSYDMRMTGVLSSVLVKNCNGDASKANTCDIVAPLLGKVGTIAYQPVTFPIKAGDISGVPKVAVTLRAGLPASLETTTTTLKVTASNGDKLICVQIMTKAAAQSVWGSDMNLPVAAQSHPASSSLPGLASVIPDVEAGTLAVSFSDCGDASTDAVVKDVVPKTITAGSTTTITGSGSLKKDITGGSYDMRMTGVLSSVLVKNCNGDASKANTCDIVAPLLGKVGTIAYQPVAFPIKAGDISGVPKVAVTLRAGLPASLETTTTTLKVTASNGDKLICVQIMTKAAAQSVSGSMAPALPLVSMPSVPSISMPPAKAIEDIVCKVAEQKWIEDKATGAICSAITKELPIPNCQSTLEKMWDKIVTMCPRGLAVEAGTLAVSFSDCGDASTDAVVKDVVPKTITAGSTTTITGSGSLKKDITGGSYDMRMTGVLSSVLVKNCNGDASKANTCDIVAPLLGKVGTIAYQPVAFPIKAGDISGVPKVAVTLRAGLPASLETTTTTLKVTASNGDKLICVQIMTKSAATSNLIVV